MDVKEKEGHGQKRSECGDDRKTASESGPREGLGPWLSQPPCTFESSMPCGPAPVRELTLSLRTILFPNLK